VTRGSTVDRQAAVGPLNHTELMVSGPKQLCSLSALYTRPEVSGTGGTAERRGLLGYWNRDKD
jgi:hypothetical protein